MSGLHGLKEEDMRGLWFLGIAALVLGVFGPEYFDMSLPERLSNLFTAGGDFSSRNVITIPQGGS
jgi:hypothetical protein